MVAILEKIKLETKKRLIHTKNPLGEESIDYTWDDTFVFEKGKIYGVICEHGGGGEGISLLLSNQVQRKEEKVYFDDVEVGTKEIMEKGWYVGQVLYSKELLKKEISVKKALTDAVKKYHKYEKVDDVVEEFHLTEGRLNFGLSRCSWERWRASLAIGYACKKSIYCFPWLNTAYFYDCLYNSAVYSFFKKIRDEGSIIILPTSRKENVSGFVDEIIEIKSPIFNRIISDNEFFRAYF